MDHDRQVEVKQPLIAAPSVVVDDVGTHSAGTVLPSPELQNQTNPEQSLDVPPPSPKFIDDDSSPKFPPPPATELKPIVTKNSWAVRGGISRVQSSPSPQLSSAPIHQRENNNNGSLLHPSHSLAEDMPGSQQ